MRLPGGGTAQPVAASTFNTRHATVKGSTRTGGSVGGGGSHSQSSGGRSSSSGGGSSSRMRMYGGSKSSGRGTPSSTNRPSYFSNGPGAGGFPASRSRAACAVIGPKPAMSAGSSSSCAAGTGFDDQRRTHRNGRTVRQQSLFEVADCPRGQSVEAAL